ncbi:SF1B family DNA helicase RecD2 [Acholeplasma granularum]|uniref:SF1B family DNA helicase RecD2 n=1 Tax=Acholeplasma granularum TaxID=264635 RepID=UPI000470168E|nr:ATP-dependent RecD-like DNA helicase [Acholeplasma granularum]
MTENITGFIKSYVYKNEDNGYTIAKIETKDGQNMTIVGYFPLLSEEIEYGFEGEFITHPRYGKQLKVINYKRLENATKTGLIRYLSSDTFSGIGPKTAEKIVDLLGLDAIDQILKDDSVLKPILNPIKRMRLKSELIAHQTEQTIFIKLLDLGLTSKIAAKLFKTYGDQTLDKLEADPYRLMYEIDGFGFIKSRDIAEKFNIEKTDIRSLKAAALYTLQVASMNDGDLYLNYDELMFKIRKILDVDVSFDHALKELIDERRIIEENGNYFTKPIYDYEIDIAKRILELKDYPSESIDTDLLKLMLSQISIQKSIDYTEKQIDAIITAMQNPITIITGGPGTGKTTLIDGLLNLYANYYKINLKSIEAKAEIALMAPTGRASKRMQELLNFNARTIHSHLGFDFESSNKDNYYEPLVQNLIIIDEASMIDIFLMRRLLMSIEVGTKIVIVGDEDQLPSVGPGYVLGDLIASNTLPVIRLNEIHRQAKDSHIVKLASSINNQNLQNDDLISYNDVTFYSGDGADIKRVILNQIAGALKKGYDLIEDIQVLIPQYKGELGIDIMNKEIQSRFNPFYKKSHSMKYLDKEYFQNDKVIQLQNDKDKGVMNGDIGIIKNITKNDKNQSIMEVSFDGVLVTYEQSELENLNLAYVISIHKSQGSEYKVVFLPIIKSYMHMLKKELIYTAITRAKQHLLILGDMRLLQYASNQLVEKRHTKLKQRLNETKSNSNLLNKDNSEVDNDDLDNISPWDFM